MKDRSQNDKCHPLPGAGTVPRLAAPATETRAEPESGSLRFSARHALLDQLSEAVLVVAPDGVIVAAGGACDRLLGVNGHELAGCNFYRELVSARTAGPELHADGRRALDGARIQRDVRCRRPRSGACFDAEISVSPFVSDEGTFLLIEIRDIGQRKKHEKRLQVLATTDPLTGVLNRRSFMDKLRYEVTRARRYRQTLSFLLIDVDDFKKFNDSYGHDVGDKVLTTFSGATRDLLRESDSIGRLGGEEFAVLLPQTGLEQGSAVADRIRRAAAGATVDTLQGPLRFTVSIGIAEAYGAALVAESLLKRADGAMYKAKRQGKNRIEADSCRHLRGGRIVKLHTA